MSGLTDTVNEMNAGLGLANEYRNEALSLVETGESKYLRDLKLNFKSVLTSAHLSDKECRLVALATAVNNNNQVLTRYFKEEAATAEATAEEMAEAAACASLLALNNVLYRFRHFTGNEQYAAIPARVRMQIMSSPVTGKEFFELMSTAISAVNGCELCVTSHEKSLKHLGTAEVRIFDAVRIASIVTSMGKLYF